MGSIIFVHGTGVRQDSFNESLGKIRAGFNDKELLVAPCFWGELHGAPENQILISVPKFQQTMDDDKPLSEEDRKLALWAVLYLDPLYELRWFEIRNSQSPADDLSRSGQLNVYEQLAPKINSLEADHALNAELEKSGLKKVWGEAIKKILDSFEYKSLQFNFDNTTEIRQAVARSFITCALQLKYPGFDSISIEARARDRMEELILELLGGRDMGAREWLFDKLMSPVTWWVRRNRGQYSADGFAFAGDVLLYQARGQGIRRFIREQILKTYERTAAPVILLAHSLGGIACVDLLIEQDLSDNVGLLITIGSQAPFLYEMNALSSLEFGKPLPDHFPARWLNIYDERDFLSYLAAGVFKGAEGREHPLLIKDIQVDNRQPFPQSHSAYWENPEVWEAIGRELQ
jgi:hypothetical protein